MARQLFSATALIAAAFVFMFAVSAPLSDALNMGTLQKSYGATAKPGEILPFTLLFWNSEEDSYNISMSGHAPGGWTIIISPKEFALGSAPEGKKEYIYIPRLKKSIGAKAVEIFVPVPGDAHSGRYNLSVDASVRSPSGAPVSLVGQKRFVFDILVEGSENMYANPEVAENHAIVIENPGILDVFPEDDVGVSSGSAQHSAGGKNTLLYAGITVILIIAWGIYRHD